jgi:hypothetical protein
MKQLLIVFAGLVVAFVLISCASTPKIMRVTTLVPLTEADRQVTKNGVTVEVAAITESTIGEHPELTVQAHVMDKGFLDKQASSRDWTIPNALCGLTFALKVTNNTGHIIKMTGSDIGLTVTGTDVRKLDREGIKRVWIGYISQKYPYQTGLPVELSSAVDAVPYWDENTRILPGKTLTCYAAFNTDLKTGIGQATMAIYDLVTNTDQAGNPTERTNFDFNLKEETTDVSAH